MAVKYVFSKRELNTKQMDVQCWTLQHSPRTYTLLVIILLDIQGIKDTMTIPNKKLKTLNTLAFFNFRFLDNNLIHCIYRYHNNNNTKRQKKCFKCNFFPYSRVHVCKQADLVLRASTTNDFSTTILNQATRPLYYINTDNSYSVATVMDPTVRSIYWAHSRWANKLLKNLINFGYDFCWNASGFRKVHPFYNRKFKN